MKFFTAGEKVVWDTACKAMSRQNPARSNFLMERLVLILIYLFPQLSSCKYMRNQLVAQIFFQTISGRCHLKLYFVAIYPLRCRFYTARNPEMLSIFV